MIYLTMFNLQDNVEVKGVSSTYEAALKVAEQMAHEEEYRGYQGEISIDKWTLDGEYQDSKWPFSVRRGGAPVEWDS